ncbi:MAG: hypothetical protein ACOC2M_01235 [bacterium]
MNIEQINKLSNSAELPGKGKNPELKETNISWVILFEDVAYKIKRPVKYSFVDFSSLKNRYYYCQKEVELNRRLAPRMYLDVIPVSSQMIGDTSDSSTVIDYAVKMKRMDNAKEMHRLLEQKQVTEKNIEKLAGVIAAFHQRIEVIQKTFNISAFQDMYADLQSVESFTRENAGVKYADIIGQSIEKSDIFLNKHARILNLRIEKGFTRNCHGDLNTFNIFLYDEPVVFDCLEFNEDFRHVDILNEIAFLCVDLDFFDQHHLSDVFIKKYSSDSGLMESPETHDLLSYYKSYRANIRAKVTLISARDNKHGDNNWQIKEACRYLDLMEQYLGEIRN